MVKHSLLVDADGGGLSQAWALGIVVVLRRKWDPSEGGGYREESPWGRRKWDTWRRGVVVREFLFILPFFMFIKTLFSRTLAVLSQLFQVHPLYPPSSDILIWECCTVLKAGQSNTGLVAYTTEPHKLTLLLLYWYICVWATNSFTRLNWITDLQHQKPRC